MQGLVGWCAGLVWDGADGRILASAQDGMEGGVVEHLTNRVFGKRRGVVECCHCASVASFNFQ